MFAKINDLKVLACRGVGCAVPFAFAFAVKVREKKNPKNSCFFLKAGMFLSMFFENVIFTKSPHPSTLHPTPHRVPVLVPVRVRARVRVRALALVRVRGKHR